MTWADLAKQTGAEALIRDLNLVWLVDAHSSPTARQTPSQNDREVAWELYIELRTRISTQPLHSLDGNEAAGVGQSLRAVSANP